MPDQPLISAFALIRPDSGVGVRFSPALPEQVLFESRKRHGAWGRNGVVCQARARELWLQHRRKGWKPGEG